MNVPRVGCGWFVCVMSCVLMTGACGMDARKDADAMTTALAGDFNVEYLANMGVLLSGGDKRVVIDALFGDGLPDYYTVPTAQRDSLEGGVGRFAMVDLVLVTHYHADHFARHG